MNIDVNAALRQVVADVGCNDGLLVDVDGTEAEIIATTVSGRSTNGDRWPVPRSLLADLDGPMLVEEAAQLAGLLPTAVHLADPLPVRGVTLLPVHDSRARLLLLWRGARPPPLERQRLDRSVQLFQLLAPLLEAHVRSRTRAAHLASIIDALEQAVVVVNADAGTAMINHAAATLLRVPVSTTTARAVADAMRQLRLRSDDPDGLERRSAELMNDASSVVSGWLWSFAEAPTHLHVHSSPIDGPLGAGRVWVFDDVSSEMRVVAAERAARAQLAESEVEARQLAAEYERASREAERANEAKTMFLSRMSHELRTPLNAVIGFAQLLELDELTAQQSAAVRHIRSGGQHLLSLINEILDISRIEAGRMTLSLEPLSALDLMRSALDLVQPTAESLSIDLQGPVGQLDGTTVRGDRQRVLQILLNLLSNAVKYNRWHGDVTFSCEVLPGGDVAFRIRDSGRGIPTDKLERLFQPFDRLGLEASTIEGTGIGLTLSKALAAAMNGRIEVESTLGVGSTFSLVLPAAEPTSRTPAPATVPAQHDDTRVDVLYIEDNPQNAALMRGIVARRPATRLRVAMDGATGVRVATEEPPDLILLDLHLPDMSGEDILIALRTHPATRSSTIVVLTADATPGLKGHLLSLGADGFLTKPVDVREVLALLRPRDGR